LSNVYREQFCKHCGHPIKIFQINICADKIKGGEVLRVFCSCSNVLCEQASNIIVQEESLGDIVFSGKFAAYSGNPDEEVLESWNLYENKHRDNTLKRWSEKILSDLRAENKSV
jgi:hypothetical protein